MLASVALAMPWKRAFTIQGDHFYLRQLGYQYIMLEFHDVEIKSGRLSHLPDSVESVSILQVNIYAPGLCSIPPVAKILESQNEYLIDSYTHQSACNTNPSLFQFRPPPFRRISVYNPPLPRPTDRGVTTMSTKHAVGTLDFVLFLLC